MRSGSPPIAQSDLGALRKLARGECVTVPSHDEHGNLVMKKLDGSQMRGFFREYAAQLADRESQPHYTSDFDPGFHIDVMHNNSSNRESHEDASTGWRSRRE